MATVRQERKRKTMVHCLSLALEIFLEKNPRNAVRLVDSGQLDEVSLAIVLETIKIELGKTKTRKKEKSGREKEQKKRQRKLQDSQIPKRPRGRPRKSTG